MRKTVFFIVFLSATCCVYAQQTYSDSSASAELVKQMYAVQRGKELPLYNGIQYSPYNVTIEGIPFFRTTEWQKGSVLYEGIRYDNISMKYELVRDQLIITPDETGGMQIALFSPRVKEFSFSGDKFVRLDNVPSLDRGFYQQLAGGKVTAFARKTRLIDEKAEITGMYRKFVDKTRYYILKNDKYYLIKNKSDLLSVLKEHKDGIQQLLATKDLNYRRNQEETITAAVEFYNQAN
jgi:hypothetical protein